jgi:hypothetical protein
MLEEIDTVSSRNTIAVCSHGRSNELIDRSPACMREGFTKAAVGEDHSSNH